MNGTDDEARAATAAVRTAAEQLREAVARFGPGTSDREIEDRNALEHLIAEVVAGAERIAEGSDSDSFVIGRDALLSIAWSLRPQPYEWNGLRCGGAYLEGDEYRYLRDVVARHGIRRAIETGAGETTALFTRLGVEVLALEAHDGPWIERARNAGADARLVPFDPGTRQFEAVALDAALADRPPVDLLFVDSPIGSANRARMCEQLLERVGARFLLVHDVHRDVRNVLDDLTRFGLHVVEYYASGRGLLLLGVGSDAGVPPQRFDPLHPHLVSPVPEPAVEFVVVDAPDRAPPSSTVPVRLRLTNHSGGLVTSHGQHPVRIAHHRFVGDAIADFEGPRTPLPCSLAPGDTLECTVGVEVPDGAGEHAYCFDLVEEGVAWFTPETDPADAHWRVRLG